MLIHQILLLYKGDKENNIVGQCKDLLGNYWPMNLQFKYNV